ncbi:MAG: hypothetical protein RIC16_09330 [Rhodospirillales bacterium]
MTAFTDADREKVAKAIAATEKTTSGELVVVVARSSDDYRYIPLLWPAAVALLAGPAAYLIGLVNSMTSMLAVQAAILVAGGLLTLWMPVRVLLVPRYIRRARAALLARAQFLAQNLHLTRNHTGVLIFVSLAEHYVEIIADKGINDRVGHEEWEAAVSDFVQAVKVGRLAEGFERVIADCGEILARNCPPEPDNPNQLPNRLIEL